MFDLFISTVVVLSSSVASFVDWQTPFSPKRTRCSTFPPPGVATFSTTSLGSNHLHPPTTFFIESLGFLQPHFNSSLL